MSPLITASTLYDLVQCPRRVELDMFGNAAERDEVSPFVAMLWKRGTLYENEVLAGGHLSALDLSAAEGEEKERLALDAMRRGEALIYSGRISSGGLGRVIPKLQGFESMNWTQVKDIGSHEIDVDDLSKPAQDRLKATDKEDVEVIYSIRLTGRERLFGIKDGAILCVLWWDPEQAVCPSEKKST